MSDKYRYITVALDPGTGEEATKMLIETIQTMRGVVSAKADVESPQDWAAYARARMDITKKLWQVLYPESKSL